MVFTKVDVSDRFNGDGDFGLWQQRTYAVLVQLKVAKALKGADNLPDSLSKDEKDDLLELAYSTVILHLGDKVLRQVNKLKTAAEVWLKLESLYMTKTLTNRIFLKDHPLGSIKHFSYNELKTATNNFDASHRLGRGGFGIVYKGILRNGLQVAVKALSVESRQGVREFMTEINTISNVRHPNLVELVGYCIQDSNRLLVYEYVENNSLDRALLGSKSTNVKLNWEQRSAICLGTAKGLAFLHEELVPHIVHRDIKASNILLDKDFLPKIGDFGLAKLFPDDITHISTGIAGTTGYLAPEYAMGGQLTLKADVYGFGVLVLEIVSGRNNGISVWDQKRKLLLEWAWELYEEGRLLDLIDPELGDYNEEDVIRYIKVAFFCTQTTATRRPVMSQVVQMLSRNIRLNEKELTVPGFFQDFNGTTRQQGSDKVFSLGESSTSYHTSSAPISYTQIIPR